jgi:methanogenic corrinoid protein MtbC1
MEEKELFLRLKQGVINFDQEDVKEAAKLILKFGIDPKRALEEALVPGLEDIYQKYIDDEYFLPDIVMAGEALNEAAEILFGETKNGDRASKSLVVLATVEGDIHDIGKNILKNLLVGSGLIVLDLGVDVEREKIIETVSEKSPSVLGLSSMVSTSRNEIKEVIKELDRRGLNHGLRILIGGESTSSSFARSSRADYGKDAFEGVRIIKEWVKAV